MEWLGLKNNSTVKTNLFLSTENPNSDLVVVCFDDITKGTTIWKKMPQKEFRETFEFLTNKNK
jgi:hypothetical protein